MPPIRMFTYVCFVTIRLSFDLGVQVKPFWFRLKLRTVDSSRVADKVKSMALHSPEIRNRHNDIIGINIVVVDERYDYEFTEFSAVRIDDEVFEVEVYRYPLNGLAYCSLDDDFFVQAELQCKRDNCEGCHKKKRVCVL